MDCITSSKTSNLTREILVRPRLVSKLRLAKNEMSWLGIAWLFGTSSLIMLKVNRRKLGKWLACQLTLSARHYPSILSSNRTRVDLTAWRNLAGTLWAFRQKCWSCVGEVIGRNNAKGNALDLIDVRFIVTGGSESHVAALSTICISSEVKPVERSGPVDYMIKAHRLVDIR